MRTTTANINRNNRERRRIKKLEKKREDNNGGDHNETVKKQQAQTAGAGRIGQSGQLATKSTHRYTDKN